MESWVKKDLKFLWHPFTQMKDCRKFPPILIERAKGVKLFDAPGNFYYDTISSWWCNVHGHNHPKINAVIKRQLKSLEHVLFAGFTHKPAILLAGKLVNISPKGLKKVFFSDNGSTSVEVALKMSFQYWQNTGQTKKTKFVSLDKGYHGDTIGAMSVSGKSLFNKVFSPMFFASYKTLSPYCYRCPAGQAGGRCSLECLKPLRALLEKKADGIAGIIIEPLLLAAGGMIIYPKEYLQQLSRLARQYRVHLIFDEVATGFGRLGEMFASDIAGVSPDLMCLSKGITGGYLSLGVTLATEKIFRAFYADYEKKKTFYHGHTYSANPLSCAAANASLEIFEKEDTLKKIKPVIAHFHKRLESFRDLPKVGDVRFIGMVAVFELVQNKKTKESFPFEKRIGFKVYQEGLKKNLILRPLGSVIYLFLPLCVTRAELEDILDRTYEVLKSL